MRDRVDGVTEVVDIAELADIVSTARRPVELFAAAAEGDRSAKARLLSLVERGGDGAVEVGRLAAPAAGDAATIGLTGAPGAGKSTLTSALIRHLRALGEEVAVLAVDPSSPFTGGAILGDRVRMQDHATDPGVFIRSMATRGHLGGLALATPEAIRLLDAMGHRWILVETVGVGQVEVEVAGKADTTVVVVNPGWGDSVQGAKAGLLEVADVFAINKADRPGVEDTRRDLTQMLELAAETAPPGSAGWSVPIVRDRSAPTARASPDQARVQRGALRTAAVGARRHRGRRGGRQPLSRRRRHGAAGGPRRPLLRRPRAGAPRQRLGGAVPHGDGGDLSIRATRSCSVGRRSRPTRCSPSRSAPPWCRSRCSTTATTSTPWPTRSPIAPAWCSCATPTTRPAPPWDRRGRALPRARARRLLVVFDEAYREFVTAPDFPDGLDVLRDHSNVAVLRTFSKAYGLAALRVGYAIARVDVINALRKVRVPFTHERARASRGAGVARRARRDARARRRGRRRARPCRPESAELGLEVVESEANFVWLPLGENARGARRVTRTRRRRAATVPRRRRAHHHRHAGRERSPAEGRAGRHRGRRPRWHQGSTTAQAPGLPPRSG